VNRLNRQLSASSRQLCTECILEGAPENDCTGCPNLTNCKAVANLRERITERSARLLQNLGLMTGIQQYHELRSAEAGSAKEQKFLDFFIRVACDKALEDRTLARIKEFHRLLRLQLDFRNYLPSVRANPEKQLEFHDRKLVYLFAPFVDQTGAYREVFEQLAACENASRLDDKLRFYDEAARAFTSIDAPTERLSESHEVVRSIVYIDCPTDVGDSLAFHHAQEMLDNYEDCKNHYWLALALVAPRSRRFDDGEWYAHQGLSHFPADPRLHHARALNLFKWILAFPEHVDRSKKRSLAIAEEREAISLCEQRDSLFPRLRGVAYNNLAYFYCYDEWSDDFDEADLKSARWAMDKLKEVIPKSTWPETDASFFHTEAQVEWYEARAARRADMLDHALFKLGCALREIQVAISCRPKELYQRLQSAIEAEMKAISRLSATAGMVSTSEPTASKET
jgi:hypothetical protein